MDELDIRRPSVQSISQLTKQPQVGDKFEFTNELKILCFSIPSYIALKVKVKQKVIYRSF